MLCSFSIMKCCFSDTGSSPTSVCWKVTMVRHPDNGLFSGNMDPAAQRSTIPIMKTINAYIHK